MLIDVQVFMPLIMEASQAKTFAYNALEFAKGRDITGYEEAISYAKKHLINAHNKQTELLQLNSREQQADVNVFLIHAMDHVTNAQIICDMAQELAELHLKMAEKV
ncbi:PTS cellobiose transporter subunit IIA [Agaribacter marinus]|uniref:PTS lactose/cellobiose transporter subunit IIA n=1 Tax=Virgibacillus salarius TaxID=447199 RepID=A0A941DXR1_9BACI|nr:PTS lactose/cellobiose transporter subunit IIA [Virgibacillus salarius]MBR7796093.1 PTS lactose/cellobiose transporter subunit IIA [Virgibacillus salarius]NAZ08802.1 PTS cellobiose transporter subunit IIA [Agaribacter marinus]